jgi:hypothetical protein
LLIDAIPTAKKIGGMKLFSERRHMTWNPTSAAVSRFPKFNIAISHKICSFKNRFFNLLIDAVPTATQN